MCLLCDRVNSFISANPSLMLKEVVHCLAVDRHTIERVLREHYAMTFRELKIKRKVEIAIVMLKQEIPRLYLKEIAADLAMTPNALSRTIKKVTGHSATKVRLPK